MLPQPINPQSRELLSDLSDVLFKQHGLLPDRERAAYEKTRESIAGPGFRLPRPVWI
jgi:hypothetical protein